jgi:hypothetical protein
VAGITRASSATRRTAVDQGSDLIREAILIGADVGDSLAEDPRIQSDGAAVHAAQAYHAQARPGGPPPNSATGAFASQASRSAGSAIWSR